MTTKNDHYLVIFTLTAFVVSIAMGILGLIRGNKQLELIISRERAYVPTSMTSVDDNLIVAQRDGLILIFSGTNRDLLLDLRDKVSLKYFEQGLFSVLISPDEQYLYVNYTPRTTGKTLIERYSVYRVASSIEVDPNTGEVVFEANQSDYMHYGGDMHFGVDGYLYISLGDGGDPRNAQKITNLYGKLLRIDVSSLPYSIPPDNPFVNINEAAKEIYAYGFRNPWRFSIDEGGNIYVGDVGESQMEEIDYIPFGEGGLNFGWDFYEGSIENIKAGGVTMPLIEYPHSRVGDKKHNCSVTGGYVYQGAYYYGDWCSGNIWTVTDGHNELFAQTDFEITSFGQDSGGNLYILTIDNGIWRIK